jgi:hypothetical protein
MMQLVVNVSYGAMLAAGLFLLGVPYAILWGFLAAVLRYIPYLGPWVGALMPVALTVAISPGWTQPLLVVVFVVVLELFSNNYMETVLYGQSIGVSEVALLISAAFWTWLWGPLGLVLTAPLTACLVVVGRHVPELEFLGVLLGDEPALESSVHYYQRLLAHDRYEAAELVEEYAASHSDAEVLDEILLPALLTARRALDRGDLDPEDEAFVRDTIRGELHEHRAELAAAEAKASRKQRRTVLGVPLRDDVDEIALEMLGRVLDPQQYSFTIASSELPWGDLAERAQEVDPDLVVIAVASGQESARTRFLCKRMRALFPDAVIAVGCWGRRPENGRLVSEWKAAGADQVGTSLAETVEQLSLDPAEDTAEDVEVEPETAGSAEANQASTGSRKRRNRKAGA